MYIKRTWATFLSRKANIYTVFKNWLSVMSIISIEYKRSKMSYSSLCHILICLLLMWHLVLFFYLFWTFYINWGFVICTTVNDSFLSTWFQHQNHHHPPTNPNASQNSVLCIVLLLCCFEFFGVLLLHIFKSYMRERKFSIPFYSLYSLRIISYSSSNIAANYVIFKCLETACVGEVVEGMFSGLTSVESNKKNSSKMRNRTPYN